MITIRFKVLSILIALVGAFLFINYASADYSYTSPAVTSLRIIQAGPGSAFLQCPSGFEPFTTECNDIVSNFNNIGDVFVINGGTNAGTYTVLSATFSPDRWTLTVTPDFVTTVADYSETFSVSTGFFTPVSGNQTWGSDNGFWGSTTASNVQSTLTAGVQNTGADLWGLLVFSGVAIAFIIFLQLVFLTKKSVAPTKRKDFDMVAFNKKADELQEFYSRDGGADPELVAQIKKRGRGRPRKNVID